MSVPDEMVLSYVECDLPPGVTIADYRRSRAARAHAEKSERRRCRRRMRVLLRRITLRSSVGPCERARIP